MKGSFFLLFVILLGLSHLVCFKAVPITRTGRLMQDPQVHFVLENIHNNKVITGHRDQEPIITERMDLEFLDYSPSGANGRHTPRPP